MLPSLGGVWGTRGVWGTPYKLTNRIPALVPPCLDSNAWPVSLMDFQGEESKSGQIIIFHQPRFPWNKGISLTKPLFGVRSCEVAIIWPDWWILRENNQNASWKTSRGEQTPSNPQKSKSEVFVHYPWRIHGTGIFTYIYHQIYDKLVPGPSKGCPMVAKGCQFNIL